MTESSWNVQDKIVLITGATNGIGKITAGQLAAQGAHVVIVSRSSQKCRSVAEEIGAQTGNRAIDWIAADLSSLAGVEEAAAEFLARYDRLDVLINNAGAVYTTRAVSADGYEMTFALNHLSYFRLTQLLRDVIVASAPARIVNVSSAAHFGGSMNFDDLMGEKKFSGWTAYSQSKLANVLFTYSLARQLDGSGVTANVLHPGFVATGFGRNNSGVMGMFMPLVQLFAISPDKGAATSIYLAASPEVTGVTGKYFDNCKVKESSARSNDVSVQNRLWQVSEELVQKAAALRAAKSNAPA